MPCFFFVLLVGPLFNLTQLTCLHISIFCALILFTYLHSSCICMHSVYLHTLFTHPYTLFAPARTLHTHTHPSHMHTLFASAYTLRTHTHFLHLCSSFRFDLYIFTITSKFDLFSNKFLNIQFISYQTYYQYDDVEVCSQRKDYLRKTILNLK